MMGDTNIKNVKRGSNKAKHLLGSRTSKWGVMGLLVVAGAFFLMPHSASALTCNDQADGNWNNAATWSCAAIPGSGDDVTIDSHTVTMTQSQAAKTLSMSGGTFNMASYTLTMSGSWTYTSGTFNAGTGRVYFNTTATFTPGVVSYYDVRFRNDNYTFTISGTATITHLLDFSGGTGGAITLNGGQLDIQGDLSNTVTAEAAAVNGTTVLNINGTGNQTVTGTGTPDTGTSFNNLTINKPSGVVFLSGVICMKGNFTYVAGTISAGTSSILFSASSTFTSGSGNTYANLIFQNDNYTTTLTSDVYLTGGISFSEGTGGGHTISGANIYVSGNLTNSPGATSNIGGTAVFIVNGTGSQTISGTKGFKNITVNKPSGILTLSGTIPITGNWTYTKGTLDAGSSTLQFTTSGATFTVGTEAYNNLEIALGGGASMTISGNPIVLGTFSYTGSAKTVNGGTIYAQGNVANTVAQTPSGSNVIEINGAGNQTISSAGGGSFPAITVNKPSGTLSLSGTVPINGSWTWTKGQLDASTSTLKFTVSSTFTPGTVRYYNVEIGYGSGGTFTVSGTGTITNNLTFVSSSYNFAGGTLNVEGNVDHTGTAIRNNISLTVNIVGQGNQTLSSSGGGALPSINVNKPSGTLTLSGTVPISGSWTHTKGAMSVGTSTLKLDTSGGTLSGGAVTYYNVTVSTNSGGGSVSLTSNLKLSNTLEINNGPSNDRLDTAGYAITTRNILLTKGELRLNGSVVKVSGNITNSSPGVNTFFTAGTSTVVLTGTNQTISGATTFYNLSKLLPDNTTDTLTFTHTTTYTIASGGTARFIGTRGYPLTVQSSSAGSAFTLTKTGNVIAEYVSLKDCTVSSATSAPASTNVSGNTNWTFTKEFVSTIRATGGDYTTLSAWETALGTVDLTAAATKVFSHGGITGTIADNASVTGATSGATGTAVHVTSTQILIKSITGTFQSGEQIRVDVSNYVTSSDTGNGAIAVAEAYNDWPNALNDSVTISGETTDADNFILVTVPASQQHQGKLKDTASSYYRGFTLKPSSSTAIVLDNQMSYTRIEGVAVDGTNATATNIRLNGTSPLGMRLISALGVDGFSLSGGAIVMNSLARDGTGKCFEDTTGATTNYTVYNSTARGCAHGFHGNNTTTAITLKNCLASGNSTADYALTNTGAKSVTYSASSDATSDDFGTTTGDRVSQTFTFIDATNKDFHLAPKDAGARNYGLDLLSDSTYPILKDIDNDVRPTVNPNDASEVSYDMGADEADYALRRFR